MCWDPCWDWLVVYASVSVAKGRVVANAVGMDKSLPVLSPRVGRADLRTLLNFAATTIEVNPLKMSFFKSLSDNFFRGVGLALKS